MARSTMVVNVTRGRWGFTVSDASREWELAVFVSHQQNDWAAFVVVLTQINGVCFSTSRLAQKPRLVQKVVNAVGWMCKAWEQMAKEQITQVVRRQFSK